MICQRCYRQTNVSTMSRFNTQEICLECEEAERKLPEYAEAAKAELEACRRGDFNFPGIGLPGRAS
jgi:hypothetical protein